MVNWCSKTNAIAGDLGERDHSTRDANRWECPMTDQIVAVAAAVGPVAGPDNDVGDVANVTMRLHLMNLKKQNPLKQCFFLKREENKF